MEKTNVTKTPVSESGKPNGEGESQKELENRIRENLRAEYERKNEEISVKLEKIEEEKAELISRLDELSNAEKNRLNSLNDKKALAEAQLNELETKPEYLGYNLKIERKAEEAENKAVDRASHETSIILMKEFIERKAEEEKITPKQLRDEINAILRIAGSNEIKYAHLMPLERAKVAYAERAEKKEIQALRDENKRLKAESDGFSEDGARSPRSEKTIQELRESAISGNIKAGIDLSKDLDSRQKEYDALQKKV